MNKMSKMIHDLTNEQIKHIKEVTMFFCGCSFHITSTTLEFVVQKVHDHLRGEVAKSAIEKIINANFNIL